MAASEALTILVGTANQHKLQEIAHILRGGEVGPTPLRVVGLEILPRVEPVAETGATFAANAGIKARAFAEAALELPPARRPDLVVADDSGLCVDALDGAPGVYSSRYAGPAATDEDNNRRLLRELSAVPPGERGAEFVCVMACVRVEAPGEVLFLAEGRCPGEILFEPRGEEGFGYDPLFYYAPLQRCFAELSGEEKNEVSHRGRALAALIEKLSARLEK